MATSTLRALILVALVIFGLIGLTKLFPGNASLGVTPTASETQGPTTTVSPSVSPTESPSPTRNPRRNSRVTVLVLNATSETGHAAEVSDRLQEAGYRTQDPKNFQGAEQDQTIVYYQADWLPEAVKMRDQFFPSARLEPAPSSVPSDVEIEVVLGADSVP